MLGYFLLPSMDKNEEKPKLSVPKSSEDLFFSIPDFLIKAVETSIYEVIESLEEFLDSRYTRRALPFGIPLALNKNDPVLFAVQKDRIQPIVFPAIRYCQCCLGR